MKYSASMHIETIHAHSRITPNSSVHVHEIIITLNFPVSYSTVIRTSPNSSFDCVFAY